jgi:hypothetical protein
MIRSPAKQPGLKMSMRGGGRRISSQHRRLDALYGRVLGALAREAVPEAQDAFERFVDAWDAHTSLEDEFYFPALRALRPAVTPDLAAFVSDHRRLRRRLRGIEARLAAGELEEAGEALVVLAGEISHHEACEEKLVAELTGGAR